MNEEGKRIIIKAWENQVEEELILSDCCRATAKYFDICSDCGEHAEFE